MVNLVITHQDVLLTPENPRAGIDGPKWNKNHIIVGTDNLVETTSIATLTSKTISATNNTIQIPYFAAELSANQGTTTTTVNKLLFNTEIADPNGWYDNATNYRFTPLLAGKWFVMATVGVSGTSVTEVDLYIKKNTTTNAGQSFILTAGTAAQSLQISKTVSMNGTTDFLEISAAATGTGTLLFLGGTGSPVTSTWFEAVYRGA